MSDTLLRYSTTALVYCCVEGHTLLVGAVVIIPWLCCMPVLVGSVVIIPWLCCMPVLVGSVVIIPWLCCMSVGWFSGDNTLAMLLYVCVGWLVQW